MPLVIRFFFDGLAPERDNSGVFHMDWDTSNGLNGEIYHDSCFFFYPLPICKVQKLRITLLRLKINTVVSSIQDTPGLFFFKTLMAV